MKNLGKKLVAVGSFLVLAAVGVLIAIYATSGDAKAVDPVSFTGAWTAQINESTFVATITGDGIEIQWNQGDDISALYWKGTFPAPLNVHKGDLFNVTSAGDTAAMADSMLASQNATKMFTYDNGTLSFELTVMGVKQTVHLKHQNDA
jgi:hypothetical protein